MAHYAKLGLDNIVLDVLAVDTIDTMTRGGIEKEELGVAHLTKHNHHATWKKCCKKTSGGEHREGGTPFRANYPGIGWYYNSEHDIFHPPRPTDRNEVPCNSWTLNTTTGFWDPPTPKPELALDRLVIGERYRWNETAYQADNTAGWEFLTPEVSE